MMQLSGRNNRKLCLAVIASMASVLALLIGGCITWWKFDPSPDETDLVTLASDRLRTLQSSALLCNSTFQRGRSICSIRKGSDISALPSSSSWRASFSVKQRPTSLSSFTKYKPSLFLKGENSFPSVTDFEARFQSLDIENVFDSSHKRLTFKALPDLIDLCSSKLDAVSCLAYLKRNKTDYLKEVDGQHPAALQDSLHERQQQKSPNTLPRSILYDQINEKALLDGKRRRSHSSVGSNNHSMKNLIHVFWKGTITRHALLCVKSFLYTQRLDRTRLVLWHVDEEALLQRGAMNSSSTMGDAGPAQSLQRLLGAFPDSIELRKFNAEHEIRLLDSLLISRSKKPTNLSESFTEDKNPVTKSDVFRFLVLTLYGGIYLDADNLLLRDLEPLFAIEFAYHWTYQKGLNTAVMGLKKHSEFGLRMHTENNGDYFPLRILPGLVDLPTAFFDPLWIMFDMTDRPASVSQSIPDLLKGASVETIGFECMFTCEVNDPAMASLFDGAFAYHWHNHWNVTWLPKSYLGWQERQIDAFLETKLL